MYDSILDNRHIIMPAYRTKNTHISQKKLENNLDKSTKRKLTYKSGGNEVENRIKDLEKSRESITQSVINSLLCL